MASPPSSRLSVAYRVSILVILACGLGASVLSYHDARRAEEDRAEAEFARRAALRQALTREILSRYTESLFGLSALFMQDGTVTRTGFVRGAVRLQRRLPGAYAFEWVPRVSAERRAAVESAMQRVYAGRKFEFTQFDAHGDPERASERPFYYPICYIEPLPGNEIALGYDISIGPTRPFLERARATGEMIVTSQFQLIQEKSGRESIIMIWPVFRSPGATASDGTAADVFVGFLECIFHVQELFDSISDTQPDSLLDLLYVDSSEADPTKRVLCFHSAEERATRAAAPSEQALRAHGRFIHEATLSFGEREWRLLCRPRAGWVESQHTSTPITRASSILILSVLLAGLVAVIGRQTKTIQREVAERTLELGESRRQLANLLHALPGMAFSGDWNQSLYIKFASEGTAELTGWQPADFESGKLHLRDIVHPEDSERVRHEVVTALRDHRDIQIEFRIRARSGEEKWVFSRGRGVYDSHGKAVAADGLIIDITDRKRAESDRLAIERKLLESQKLESLGLLAGGIAHDFNNLLSAVLGNASLARMTIEPGNAADGQLRAIETAALRAAELCRQMLAYAGKGRFVVERVDVSAIVGDLLPLLRVSIARSATLHLDLMREVPAVKADATQIRQIVMNLVLNAVDALSGRNGEITIRTGVVSANRETLARCVTGNALPLGDYVFLEVRDTGTGMTPEVQSKIFDPFFTTKFSGRGLGLAAVLGIVRGHNGALLVESEVDRGTLFRLFLPALAGEMTRLAVQAETPTNWRQSGDVLVIEDEEPVREVMVEMLRSFGFQPHAVADGRSGVVAFRDNASRWSLVVIDLLMPGMSGEETLGALRAIKSDVRVLLMSGYAEGDVLTRTRGAGQIGFLAKPFKRDAFEAKLKELFTSATNGG